MSSDATTAKLRKCHEVFPTEKQERISHLRKFRLGLFEMRVNEIQVVDYCVACDRDSSVSSVLLLLSRKVSLELKR